MKKKMAGGVILACLILGAPVLSFSETVPEKEKTEAAAEKATEDAEVKAEAETPKDAEVKAAAETPKNAEVKVEAETPKDAEVKAAAETPKDAEVKAEAETPKDAEVKAAAETPKDAGMKASEEAPEKAEANAAAEEAPEEADAKAAPAAAPDGEAEAETAEEVEKDVSHSQDPLIPYIDISLRVDKGARIAVVSKSTKGEFWDELYRGMKEALADVNDAFGLAKDSLITMTFEGPADEQDVETQINTLEAVVSENPSVICLCAGDMESCQAQLEAASENGIPVVGFDSAVSESGMICAFRGSDNTAIGRMAAEKIAETLSEEGEIVVFSEQEKTEAVRKRMEGFQEEIDKHEGIHVAEVIYQDQVEDMGAAIVETLTANPDIKGVYCNNAVVTDLYLSVVPEEFASLPMIGTDCSKKQQEAIRDGREVGVVSQNPFAIGYQTILAAAFMTGGGTDADSAGIEEEVLLPPLWIDALNMDAPDVQYYIY